MDDRPVPFPARPWVLLGIAVALLLGVLGFTIGRQAATSETVGPPIPAGTLIQVHLADERVILGIFMNETNGHLVLTEPAELANPGARAGQLDVVPLADGPTAIDGNLLLERAQIAFLGAVHADTPLRDAYVEATGVESTAPSPSSE